MRVTVEKDSAFWRTQSSRAVSRAPHVAPHVAAAAGDEEAVEEVEEVEKRGMIEEKEGKGER